MNRKQRYTIIMVPHSVATRAAFMLDGEIIEVGDGDQIFGQPQVKRTEDYVTGRFG